MKSKASEQVLVALHDVVGMALKELNENKAEVLEALHAARPARHDPPQVKRAAPELKKAPEFLGTAAVTAR